MDNNLFDTNEISEEKIDKKPMNKTAIASMVLGILAVFPSFNMFFGIIALVLGIISRSYGNRSAFSLVGIITGTVPIVFNILLFALSIVLSVLAVIIKAFI